MKATAVLKEVTEDVPVSANGKAANGSRPELRMVPLKDLRPSPTNPRRRFDEQFLESLAVSIGKQNILEPLIVRQKGEGYEIVCGEQRYRSAAMVKDENGKPAPLGSVPCLVRELTDEQVLDIQIHENLHRKDVHPMDEAYGYRLLKEKLGCDVKELALRVGKSEGYVLNRLKLNELIKEAQQDIDDGYLPLVFALEIAKYTPDIQKVIYDQVYNKKYEQRRDKYVFVPIKGQTVPWRSFTEWINTNVHRLLAKAPFDKKATNLREDGLACINCPERTGASVTLFEPNQIGKKDACLNPECFMKKVQRHLVVRRQELAELSEIDPSEVPVVRSWSHSNGDGYLGSESAIVVGDIRGATRKKCKNAVSGIDVEPENYGQTVQVCLKSSGCKIHWQTAKASTNGKSASGASGEAEAAANLDAHRARREEIWNSKVAETVRVRIFKQAAEKFEKKFRISDVGTDLLPQLVARFWRMSGSGDSTNLNNVVKTLLAEWSKDDPEKNNGVYVSDGRSGIEYVKKLRREMQFRILFLLIHCHKGSMGYNNSYSSQKEVKGLAKEFAVDHALIDAEVRFELSPKKHLESHKSYLEAVRKKDRSAAIPWLFSEKWRPKD